LFNFDLQLPTYLVITPQTKVELTLQSLTISDENKLKTSLLNDKGITELLNRILFEKIEEKPIQIQTYEDFLSHITLNDREALIAGLYHATYGDDFKVDTTCPKCGALNENKVTISEIGKVEFFDGEPFEILEKEFRVELPISKSLVTIKAPTLSKEIELFDMLNKNDPLFMYGTFIYVDSITYQDSAITMQESPYDILAFLSMLPARERKILDKEINENISKYNVTLPFKVRCMSCEHEYTSNMNFLQQLFRMALESEE